jgi:hypothetical protein
VNLRTKNVVLQSIFKKFLILYIIF